MISERPAEAADRALPGHWEGDLITGKDGRSASGTLVERATRYVMLLHLPGNHTAETVPTAPTATAQALPAQLMRSLTWDQGSEMDRHAEFTLATDIPVYFCDPAGPWQRGSNENTYWCSLGRPGFFDGRGSAGSSGDSENNGLLRQYFPKGSSLSVHDPEHLAAVADQLNRRPRKTLGRETPAERLHKLLTT